MSGHPGLTSVLLAGGGSAGHVSPLLALADCLRRRDRDIRITTLGTVEGLEQRLVPARGYDLRTIPKVAFPRRPGAALARLPGALKAAVDAAGAAIDETRPEVVVGFGGYVAAPAYLARYGMATQPEDLHHHNCLNFNFRRAEPVWPFRIDGRDIALSVKGNIEANNGETLGQLAAAGVGIARVGAFSVVDAAALGARS